MSNLWNFVTVTEQAGPKEPPNDAYEAALQILEQYPVIDG